MNRGLGTVTAGSLALAVAELAAQMGKYSVVFLIISNFVVGEYSKLLDYSSYVVSYFDVNHCSLFF
jgi:hypothetical protein